MIKPHRVVYLYHDRIDAIGDKLATEAETFHAVRQTLDELADLTAKIVNSLNGNQVLITADHGFLFQERPLDETDKNALSEKPPGTVLAKKRYLLGRHLPESDQVFHGSTVVTAGTRPAALAGAKSDPGAGADSSAPRAGSSAEAVLSAGTGGDPGACSSAGAGSSASTGSTAGAGSGTSGDMEFWIPKGANRFHFVGGARFVHGGAMPQEIAVPVIRVQHLRGSDKAAKTQVRTVGVSVLGNNFKVTTNRHRFQLIQTEPVGERVKPATLKIALYDGEEPLTNIETLTFDSTSKDMNYWKKTVSLTLEGRRFDSKRVYQLLLRDAETGVEEARFDVMIDLLFESDF